MRRRPWLRLVLTAWAITGGVLGATATTGGAEPLPRVVEFNRDIRPILSNNCFACHGPDKNQRKADLRLDLEKEAFADLGGYRAIVPGKPGDSELYLKITAEEVADRMPPKKFGKTLTRRQIDLIRRWIEQGAHWEKHWSLLAPRRPALPEVSDRAWPLNAVDYFIRARLDREGLRPSPEADRRTLLRRLSFDLTGLPPAPEELDRFLADRSAEAYERQVDRLLASPHFGERLAMYWLDLVRYADTNGYHGDNHRDIAPYRDYVIQTFNDNKPFDRFTVEQLAGDLLPRPTAAQKIASGYNRLLMTTREGGAQAKEYLAKYAADRVRNTSSVWLGATLGCAECHDHKFDPYRTREFYRFAAFFADLKETAVGMQERVKVPTAEQEARLRELDGILARLRPFLTTPSAQLDTAQARWEARLRQDLAANRLDWVAVKPERLASAGGATLVLQADLSVLATGKNPAKDVYTVTLPTDRKHITGIRLEALTHPSLANQSLARGNGNFVLTRIEVEANGQPVPLAAAVADHSQAGFPVANAIDPKSNTGWAVEGHVKRENRTAVFTFARPVAGGPGTLLTVRLKHESIYAQHNIGRFRLALTSVDKPSLSQKGGLPPQVALALAVEPGKRTAAQKELLARHYRSIAPELAPLRRQIAALEKQKAALTREFPQTLISMPVAPRVMRVLRRGNWLDDSGAVVEPGVPASLPPLPVKGRRANRLDLARWLVAADHPMVARVFVNRLWKLCFGQGIVKTLDDFGSQGAWPTHPRLLDWLAVEFRTSGWNVKYMLKLLVMSRSYRQSSQVSEALRQRDPFNQWLARQARFRLDAEMVRDNALAVSGLLVRRIGGQSAKPYQPARYWAQLNFPMREYQKDVGPNVYRRGLYTYWCRTFLHPSLLAFDAPTREECTVERPRSNTPQQALVLLNDPTYVEAARALAERLLRQGGRDAGPRIQFAFRQVLCRHPRQAELSLLEALYQKHLREYRADPRAAEDVLRVGDRPMSKGSDAAELAAWTSVARVILNLHETISRH
jgi:hypothetical protein